MLKDFERGLGLGTPGSGPVSSVKRDDKVESKSRQDAADLSSGTKRKFEFDQGAVERLAQEAEDAALAEMDSEQVSPSRLLYGPTKSQLNVSMVLSLQAEARRSKLPSFWLPTLAPEAKIGPLKDVKLQTLCNVGHSHPLA